MSGNLRVLEREDHLEETRKAGGSLQVAEVGLDRPDPERLLRCAPQAEDGGERLDLDGVAESGAGAVGFNVADVARFQSGIGQRGAGDGLLCGAVRRSQPGAGAILIDGRSADEREDAVAIALRLGEAFHDHHGAPLGLSKPIGSRVEGLAPAIRGHHSGLAHPR